jgi:hypothetical protein
VRAISARTGEKEPIVKNRLLGAGLAASIALGLVGIVAAPASAITLTDYCYNNLRAHTEKASVLPTRALRCQMQAGPARAYGYKGTINGTFDKASWTALQKYLKANWQLIGPVTGKPGPHTYGAMQRAANASGYFADPVKVDGTMALKDWQGWAYRVTTNFFGN